MLQILLKHILLKYILATFSHKNAHKKNSSWTKSYSPWCQFFLRMLVICIKTHITIVFKLKYPCENRALMESYSSGYPIFLKMLPNCIKTYCYGFTAKIPSWRTVHWQRAIFVDFQFPWKYYQFVLKHILQMFSRKNIFMKNHTLMESNFPGYPIFLKNGNKLN